MRISSKLRSAVFLDRDGTINQEKDYLHRIEDFEFIFGVPQALKKLQDADFSLVVVTNQSGVARGYFSIEKVHLLHEYMCSQLRDYGVRINGIYVCPHHPARGFAPYNIKCECRKGKPGMLLKAAMELGVELDRSYMIGDKQSDVEAGIAAGCRSILVQSGYGKNVQLPAGINCEGIFSALPEAVEYILQVFDQVENRCIG